MCCWTPLPRSDTVLIEITPGRGNQRGIRQVAGRIHWQSVDIDIWGVKYVAVSIIYQGHLLWVCL